MPSTFLHAKPLQALKLGAVFGVLAFGLAGMAGLLGERGLDGLLYLAFSLWFSLSLSSERHSSRATDLLASTTRWPG